MVLILSFYLEPLNLLWQGMHTPNMFLFRFSFLFCFMVLMTAGYGLEKWGKDDYDQLTTVLFGLIAAFVLVKLATSFDEKYSYINGWSLDFYDSCLTRVSMLVLPVEKQRGFWKASAHLDCVAGDWRVGTKQHLADSRNCRRVGLSGPLLL
ncbi:YfhO family protein [uncultured Enterococcus sp.]|uniref:YfhO family protein n=1 Tax=uncultured Enterococcus sp. TaxID=167972 RepID=UPI003749634A